jgi:hypothetical protein
MISRKLLHKTLNVLTAIRGFMELAKSEEDPEKRNKTLDKSLKELDKLTMLLNSQMVDKAHK